MNRSNDRSNQSVTVGGEAKDCVFQMGDNNVADLQFHQTTLPMADSVDIQSEFAGLRQLLCQLPSADAKKIDRALEDAHDELGRSEPDRDEVGEALDRALKYAKKAEGFVEAASKLRPHITGIVSWLGHSWHKLLTVVGLTL